MLGRLEVSEATMLAQTATEVSFDAGETIALEDTPGAVGGVAWAEYGYQVGAYS